MIGDIIKKYREERGWTQEELATRMGYASKSTINKIEKNINDISQTKIEKFARVFGCEPTELIVNSSVAGVEPGVAHIIKLPEYDWGYESQDVEKAMDIYRDIQSLSPERRQALQEYLRYLKSQS